jgi:hypothetical protein
MATLKRLAKVLRIVGNVVPEGIHVGGDHRDCDFVSIELNDPKDPEIEKKTMQPKKLFGDLAIKDQPGGAAMRLATPEEAILRLTTHQMGLHGYTSEEIANAKKVMSPKQLAVHEKQGADEKLKLEADKAAKNGLDPSVLISSLTSLVGQQLQKNKGGQQAQP